MQIQLSENTWLTSSKRSYEISQRNKRDFIVPIAFFSDLSECFKFYLDLNLKNSQAVEFSELIILHVESIREIKKCCKKLEEQNVRTTTS